ncbi:MAG: protease complex subunit PrcB family protein [Firmicutes bacterium]|nr:protease complex subunit PrcB family protein [Bacillota bacterium]
MRISTKWIISVTLVCTVLFAGCAGNTPDNSQPNTNGETKKTDAPNTSYPQEVTQALEATKTLKVGTSVIVDNKTYVIASFGQQPTAGYDAHITDIELEGNKATATVGLEPPQGDAAATVVTYPQAVKVLEGRYENIAFVKEGDYMPQVVGLQKPLKKTKYVSENIRVIDYNPSTAEVAGIARVFEAIVSYQMRDAQGKVLKRGNMMALSGAPDWGYFELELDKLPQEASEIILYQASAKDGSMQDEVHLPVKRSTET